MRHNGFQKCLIKLKVNDKQLQFETDLQVNLDGEVSFKTKKKQCSFAYSFKFLFFFKSATSFVIAP